ncbi:hypothetical protein DENIS_1070 [Desulfonema ishimotonii]|uniref:Chemotaxis protein n=2 Tax=Desulfonema ishimotonii TaxID=45657 RepID=A0A401FT30_9BACT|nr:hypothetical protein DENIS_1070 [Desulfonema ishimotonii]
MKKVEAEGRQHKLSAVQLNLELYDLVGIFAGTIEQAADQVIEKSTDNKVRRHALLWKINAVPMAYRALLNPDPGIAGIDTWVFSKQMLDYFRQGPGKEDFGPWNQIPVDASRFLENKMTELTLRNDMSGSAQNIRMKVHAWANAHPIQQDFIYRDTSVPFLNSMIEQQKTDLFSSLGSLSFGMEDMSGQLNFYMNLLTKQARWQAELAMTGTDHQPGIRDVLIGLNVMESAVNRMLPVLEEFPDVIARERRSTLKSLQKERMEVLTSIEHQRQETLDYLSNERLALTNDLQSERQAVLDILIAERKAVSQSIANILESERKEALKSIHEQRVETLLEIESAGNRIVENTMKQSIELIDHFFIRVLQLLAGILLIGIVIAVIVFLRKKAIKN